MTVVLERGFRVLSLVLLIAGLIFTWLLWPVVPGLVMTALATAIPWGVFYLIRLDRSGFSG